MKKLFQIFSLLLVLNAFAFPQKVYDSLTVSDQVGGIKVLYFGLDPQGTDGIDPLLGESYLPPFPPPGAFDGRLFLPENAFSGTASSWRDFRNMPAVPYSGTVEYRIAFQLGFGSPGCKISWQFPSYITAGSIQDLFGGVLINVPMVGTGFFNVVPALDRLKMLITYTGALPVEMTSFAASVTNGSVVLNWQTATEVNNRGFQVERKSLSSGWENIGFVDGFGTSTEVHSYSYMDRVLSSGSYTYRLKQVDLSGAYNYSKEVTADVELALNNFSLNQNYPNPFNPTTEISFSVPNQSLVNITVYDVLGKEVKVLFNGDAPAGVYKTAWDGLNSSGVQMSSGTYIYKMTAGEFVQCKKMSLMK